MNAMQIANAQKPRTIGELQAYLTKLEKAWSEQDSKFLGKFTDQSLYMSILGKGIAHAEFSYHPEFGLIVFPNVTIHPDL
jgi:hypothetical protein